MEDARVAWAVALARGALGGEAAVVAPEAAAALAAALDARAPLCVFLACEARTEDVPVGAPTLSRAPPRARILACGRGM